MSRTLRIVLFGGVALAAWCFSSDQLLSRVASDEGMDDAAADGGQPDAPAESDYQVVKLLSKLFTSIKRNHVEVLNLHRQYARSEEPAERSDLKRQMQERVLKDREGLSPEEQIKKDEELILKDPRFGPFWRRLAERKRQAS